jgi:hypothetical protein
VGFEPTIPVFERAKTVYALDRAVTVICGHSKEVHHIKHTRYHFNDGSIITKFGGSRLTASSGILRAQINLDTIKNS